MLRETYFFLTIIAIIISTLKPLASVFDCRWPGWNFKLLPRVLKEIGIDSRGLFSLCELMRRSIRNFNVFSRATPRTFELLKIGSFKFPSLGQNFVQMSRHCAKFDYQTAPSSSPEPPIHLVSGKIDDVTFKKTG